MLLEALNNAASSCILCGKKLETILLIRNKSFITQECSLINNSYPLTFKLFMCFRETTGEFFKILDNDIINDYYNNIESVKVRKTCINHYSFYPQTQITIRRDGWISNIISFSQEEILKLDDISIINTLDRTSIHINNTVIFFPRQELSFWPIHNNKLLKIKIEKLQLLK